MTKETQLRADEWERVASALAALVRDEYPAGLTLTQIATRWGFGNVVR